jgi:sulfatase maturation enzyme AslB (radical SAM superfamily)
MDCGNGSSWIVGIDNCGLPEKYLRRRRRRRRRRRCIRLKLCHQGAHKHRIGKKFT